VCAIIVDFFCHYEVSKHFFETNYYFDDFILIILASEIVFRNFFLQIYENNLLIISWPKYKYIFCFHRKS